MLRVTFWVLLLGLVLLGPALPAAATPFPCGTSVMATFTEGPGQIPTPTPVATWTLIGCWKSRPWVTTCLDVFRDETGALYICKACGTTGNPNKGKCRATTQEELNSGTWCGAVE